MNENKDSQDLVIVSDPQIMDKNKQEMLSDNIKISYSSHEKSMLTMQEKKDLDLLLDKLFLEDSKTLYEHLQFLSEVMDILF